MTSVEMIKRAVRQHRLFINIKNKIDIHGTHQTLFMSIVSEVLNGLITIKDIDSRVDSVMIKRFES